MSAVLYYVGQKAAGNSKNNTTATLVENKLSAETKKTEEYVKTNAVAESPSEEKLLRENILADINRKARMKKIMVEFSKDAEELLTESKKFTEELCSFIKSVGENPVFATTVGSQEKMRAAVAKLRAMVVVPHSKVIGYLNGWSVFLNAQDQYIEPMVCIGAYFFYKNLIKTETQKIVDDIPKLPKDFRNEIQLSLSVLLKNQKKHFDHVCATFNELDPHYFLDFKKYIPSHAYMSSISTSPHSYSVPINLKYYKSYQSCYENCKTKIKEELKSTSDNAVSITLSEFEELYQMLSEKISTIQTSLFDHFMGTFKAKMALKGFINNVIPKIKLVQNKHITEVAPDLADKPLDADLCQSFVSECLNTWGLSFEEQHARDKKRLKEIEAQKRVKIQEEADRVKALEADNKRKEEAAHLEEKDKLTQKNALLEHYVKMDKELKEMLRKILTLDNIDRTIAESDVVRLATELQLKSRETDSGFLIEVYKTQGAGFHNSHGRDLNGKVCGEFVAELSKAFKYINLIAEDLNKLDSVSTLRSAMA